MSQKPTFKTQTDSAPTAEHIIAWLAEQPCLKCGGSGWGWDKDARRVKDRECGGIGLAFPWASEACICGGDTCLCHACALTEAMGDGAGAHIPTACRCNGSGRVPKAVGLEELMEAKPWVVHEALAIEHAESLSENRRPNYMLTALRAVAAHAGMPL